MPGLLDGVRVVEVATWIAVPACGALLADLGATVMKVESPTGDIWRATARRVGAGFPGNPAFQVDNRGKRSIAVNLEHVEGQAVVRRLLRSADVLTTNLVPRRQQRYGLTYAAAAAENPRLIYLAFSGYGDQGPERDRLGFDFTAFWARSGMLEAMTEPGSPPPMPPGSTGDHATAPLLLAGVLGALYERERSGRGQQVATSLLNSALWAISSDLQQTLISRQPLPHTNRADGNPVRNTYRSADGVWFLLMAPEERDWPKVCTAIDRPDLAVDPRFATFANRSAHNAELIALLDGAFGARALADLGPRFDAQGVVWGPVQSMRTAIDDPQVRANGYVTMVEHPTFGPFETPNTPLRYSRSETGPKGAAPEIGQHTEEVLLEAGYTWDDIGRLREEGAIGV